MIGSVAITTAEVQTGQSVMGKLATFGGERWIPCTRTARMAFDG